MKKHDKFVEKFKLPFTLLADEDKKIVEAYGVWGEKSFMGRKYLGTHRVTFLIGPDGTDKKIWPPVKPEEHAAEVLAALEEFYMSEIFVIGHRNPDTDAICSAIGYAEFKRRTGMPEAVAARCGDTNERIDFVLETFGVPSPPLRRRRLAQDPRRDATRKS